MTDRTDTTESNDKTGHAWRSDNPIATGSEPEVPRVLIVRHAQTFANAHDYFLGQLDEGITEVGEQQSAAAVQGIVDWAPERIVTSPLLRCCEKIAGPAAEALGVPLEIDERLKEFDFGPLEGKTFAEVVEKGYPFPWGPGSEEWPPAEGGETMPHFLERLGHAAHDLEGRPGRTAVVCHGGVIRGLFAVWLHLDIATLNQLVVGNVSGCVFRTQPGDVLLERFGLKPADFGKYRA